MRSLVIFLICAACRPFPSIPDQGACVTGGFVREGRHSYFHVRMAGRMLSDDELDDRLLAEPHAAADERAAHRWHVTSFLTLPAMLAVSLISALALPSHTSGELATEVFVPVIVGSAVGGYAQVRGDADHRDAIEEYATAARDRCPP